MKNLLVRFSTGVMIFLLITSLSNSEILIKQAEEKLIIKNNYLNIEYNLKKGSIDVLKPDGKLVIKGGYSAVLYRKNA
jgi:hypothetical protein